MKAYRAGRLGGIPIEEVFMEEDHAFAITVAHRHRKPDYWVDENASERECFPNYDIGQTVRTLRV